jgi:hypothetical protein
MSAKQLIVLATVATVAMASAATAVAKPPDLSTARLATAGYHNIAKATAAGYEEFSDTQGIACIDDPAGGMGIHYVNGGLVMDGAVNAATPEALVYEPEPNGRLRLVAVEYIVPQPLWTGSERPTLFGETFGLIPGPNRYGQAGLYELHAWLWKHNPSGMFNDWNPRVECPTV